MENGPRIESMNFLLQNGDIPAIAMLVYQRVDLLKSRVFPGVGGRPWKEKDLLLHVSSLGPICLVNLMINFPLPKVHSKQGLLPRLWTSSGPVQAAKWICDLPCCNPSKGFKIKKHQAIGGCSWTAMNLWRVSVAMSGKNVSFVKPQMVWSNSVWKKTKKMRLNDSRFTAMKWFCHILP